MHKLTHELQTLTRSLLSLLTALIAGSTLFWTTVVPNTTNRERPFQNLKRRRRVAELRTVQSQLSGNSRLAQGVQSSTDPRSMGQRLQLFPRREAAVPPCGTISDCAYEVINQRIAVNRNKFFVFQDANSPLNHGYSALFGNIDLQPVLLDANCVYDSTSNTGCATNTSALDTTRGTVFRFSYPALSGSSF